MLKKNPQKRRLSRPIKLNSLLGPGKVEGKKRAAQVRVEDNLIQTPIFDNFRSHLERKEEGLKEFLETSGAGKYYERLSAFGVSGAGELRNLSTEDLNFLRIPGNVQNRLIQTKNAGFVSPETMGSTMVSKGTSTQTQTRHEFALQTEESEVIEKQEKSQKAIQNDFKNIRKSTKKRKRSQLQKNENRLETINESFNEEPGPLTHKNPVSKENWFDNIGSNQIDVFGMFSKPKSKVISPVRVKPRIKKQVKIACYNCFVLIRPRDALTSEYDSTQHFCSIDCQNQLNLQNKEICSICLRENNKLDMEMCFGDFICKSSSCRKMLKSIKTDFKSQKTQFQLSGIESSFDKIFNF